MSTADLEIAVLYETHELLADIISPFLYSVEGSAPEQQAHFISEETLALFSIRVGEFVSEPIEAVIVDDSPKKLSLLGGLKEIAPRLRERSAPSLRCSVDALTSWMESKHEFRFWCGEIGEKGRHLEAKVTHRKLWKTHANLRKHTAFRLTKVMRSLQDWTRTTEYDLVSGDVRVAMHAFDGWLRGYVEYNATMVAELLGSVFLQLNRVICERWDANRSATGPQRTAQSDGTSAEYADLHANLLSLKRYEESRISAHIPITSRSLSKPYPV